MMAKSAGGGKGGSGGLVDYLEKESAGQWLTVDQNGLPGHVVEAAIDRNKANLSGDDDKFYHIIIAPSDLELKHIGGDESKLEAFTRAAMQQYAENFGKGLESKDLTWYGKVEHNRTHDHTDRQVQTGEIEKGTPKAGHNTHIHIIVSRTENLQTYNQKKREGLTANDKGKDRKPYKLSPNTHHQATQKGPVTGGFSRVEFSQRIESEFDKLFKYPRQLVHSFEYKNTMKNGDEQAKAAMELRAEAAKPKRPEQKIRQPEPYVPKLIFAKGSAKTKQTSSTEPTTTPIRHEPAPSVAGNAPATPQPTLAPASLPSAPPVAGNGPTTPQPTPAPDKPVEMILPLTYKGHIFSQQDKQNLLQTGEMGRAVTLKNPDGTEFKALLGLDLAANQLKVIHVDKLSIFKEIQGVTLTQDQQQALKNHQIIRVDGLVGKDKIPYTADIQLSAVAQRFKILRVPELTTSAPVPVPSTAKPAVEVPKQPSGTTKPADTKAAPIKRDPDLEKIIRKIEQVPKHSLQAMVRDLKNPYYTKPHLIVSSVKGELYFTDKSTKKTISATELGLTKTLGFAPKDIEKLPKQAQEKSQGLTPK